MDVQMGMKNEIISHKTPWNMIIANLILAVLTHDISAVFAVTN